MLKLIITAMLTITLITGCTISYSETSKTTIYKVSQVFPPVYYGTEDYPVSGFYVILTNTVTGERTDKLFVDERCEDHYQSVDVGRIYALHVEESKALGLNSKKITNLKSVLCN
jgi:hypothetical protein